MSRDPATSPSATARIAAWLQPHDSLLDVECRDRESVVRIAGVRSAKALGLPANIVVDALWRRELSGSTALGGGLAIPHARVDGIDQPSTLYLRTRTPVAFDAADGRGVSELLVILVPREGSSDDHLQLLALVSQLFSDDEFRAALDAAADASAVAAAFRAGIDRLAGA